MNITARKGVPCLSVSLALTGLSVRLVCLKKLWRSISRERLLALAREITLHRAQKGFADLEGQGEGQ
ncbi:MAG: hypothetical protein LR015_04940 [Verrucomicrobia bacterium]|nr:hypothetical protein [Verrucomicrobiota bacterium]